MKRNIHLLLLLPLLALTACNKEELPAAGNEEVSDKPLFITADIAGPAGDTKNYGETGIAAVNFTANDQIGIFITHTRDDGQLPTRADVFYTYANVGYRAGTLSQSGGKDKTVWSYYNGTPKQPQLCAPIFPSTKLDIYAYHPWPANNEEITVVNTEDIQKMRFRLYQDQGATKTINSKAAMIGLNFSDIKRADPIRNKSYPLTGGTTQAQNELYRPVNLRFRHIMSQIEFHMYKDDRQTLPVERRWNEGDQLFYHRLTMFGNKINTDGTFNLVADDPEVTAASSLTSTRTSVFKADQLAAGSAVPDSWTGPTTGGSMFLRRNLIIPPVPRISANPVMNPVTKQYDVEMIFEMTYQLAGETEPHYTNRHYIVKDIEFKSGYKYIFEIYMDKHTYEGDTPIQITATSVQNWTEVHWGVTFD